MHKLTEKIFSIKEYNETSIIIRLCFIKIKLPKLKYILIKRKSPFYKYKKQNLDITTVPAATGQLREIQLANLELLKELDYVCRQNNLTYWLEYGTLLGAIRHKGFIPWDDDIDTSMLRRDYDKIIEAFKNSSRNKDIYAEYYRMPSNPGVIFIKIKHKKAPHLFADIFPWDICEKNTEEEQIKISENLKQIQKDIKIKAANLTDKELINIINKTIKDNFIQKQNNINNGDIVRGIDFCHQTKNLFVNSKTIFPLKMINFEGVMLPVPNDTNTYLTQIYGDYMSYPRKLTLGHSAFITPDKEEREVIKNIIKRES